MTRTYRKVRKFILYSVVFGMVLSLSSFVTGLLGGRDASRGRIITPPAPLVPIASADTPSSGGTSDSISGDDGDADADSDSDSDSCDAGDSDCDAS